MKLKYSVGFIFSELKEEGVVIGTVEKYNYEFNGDNFTIYGEYLDNTDTTYMYSVIYDKNILKRVDPYIFRLCEYATLAMGRGTDNGHFYI